MTNNRQIYFFIITLFNIETVITRVNSAIQSMFYDMISDKTFFYYNFNFNTLLNVPFIFIRIIELILFVNIILNRNTIRH